MRVEETRDGKFDLWVSDRYDADREGVELAELVELKVAIDRALFDYLCREVSGGK